MRQFLRCKALGFTVLAAGTALAVRPLDAQTRSEREAFTWSGKIADGRWINVRNLNGSVQVEPGTSDKVEVTASRHTKRGDPDYVRFEVRKYGPGNQDVLIARLEDARFYWETDLKHAPAARVEALKDVVWMEGLGSLREKAARLEILCAWLAQRIGPRAVGRIWNALPRVSQAGLTSVCQNRVPSRYCAAKTGCMPLI